MTGQLVANLQGHQERVSSVCFSHDGHLLASGAAGETDNSVYLWDVIAAATHKAELAIEAADRKSPDEIWEALANKDPVVGYAASKGLGQVLEKLRPRMLAELRPTDVNELKVWIGDLSSPEYRLRQAATQALIKHRSAADTLLRDELQRTASAEAGWRLEKILKTHPPRDSYPTVELRRWWRIVYGLQIANTDAAEEMMTAIAAGHPSLIVMQAAAIARRRVED